jgi:hypothetical protein
VRGHLDGARFVIRLDIGIDDAVVPDPGWVEYPSLLDGPAPRILAYQPATAVAEKFQALVSLGLVNSRLKDFYDLWMLATTQEFDGQQLRDALTATFAKRETELPSELPVALTSEFYEQDATAKMWDAFAAKMKNSGTPVPERLADVVDVIIMFIMPAAAAAAAGEPFAQAWTSDGGWRPQSS